MVIATATHYAETRLHLSVQYACTSQDNVPTRSQFRRWVSRALFAAHNQKAAQTIAVQTAATQAVEITLRIVEKAEGRDLNHNYRGKDYATNVLSFAYDNVAYRDVACGADQFGQAGNIALGDLVLCAPVIIQEANEQAKPIMAHWAHMVIHGILHLQGYDHEEEAQASIMEALEITILKELNIANPY